MIFRQSLLNNFSDNIIPLFLFDNNYREKE